MRILLNVMIFLVAMLITMAVTIAYAGDTILACTQPDGTVVYTNKDVKGCAVVKTPELSIVPDRHAQHDTHLGHVNAIPLREVPLLKPTASPESEVVTKTCALYKEWVLINERTKGGFEYNDVEDTKHRLYLTKIFGSGFSPTMCKE